MKTRKEISMTNNIIASDTLDGFVCCVEMLKQQNPGRKVVFISGTVAFVKEKKVNHTVVDESNFNRLFLNYEDVARNELRKIITRQRLEIQTLKNEIRVLELRNRSALTQKH